MFFWAFNKFMNEKNRLENELKKFDGVAVSLLSEARIKCRDTPDYFDEINLVKLYLNNRGYISFTSSGKVGFLSLYNKRVFCSIC